MTFAKEIRVPDGGWPAALRQLVRRECAWGFHFQPIVDLERGVTVGYEGLVRFPAELGLRPDEIFEIAGRHGMRTELEAAVMEGVLAARSELPANCFLSVNAGPGLLLSKQWDAILASARLEGVVVEVTEEESIGDYGALRTKLDRIRHAGGYVAVDDTGAGYASLKHVMELRPNFIKLDRFFVGGCDHDPTRTAMIEMLGGVANRLDAWIVAEGVETAGELDELMRLRVPMAQGFYLGRPEPGMQTLIESTAGKIRRRRREAGPRELQHVLEACGSWAEEPAAKLHLESNPHVIMAALTDGWGRPVGLLERHPLLGARKILQPMKAQANSDSHEVLQRALTRPQESRFDPILVVNEQGGFEGVVLTDRLMRHVLKAHLPIPPSRA